MIFTACCVWPSELMYFHICFEKCVCQTPLLEQLCLPRFSCPLSLWNTFTCPAGGDVPSQAHPVSAGAFVIKKDANNALNSSKIEFTSLRKNNQIPARFGLNIWKYSAYYDFIQKSFIFFFLLKQESCWDICHIQNIISMFLKAIFPQPVPCRQPGRAQIPMCREPAGLWCLGWANPHGSAQRCENWIRTFRQTEIHKTHLDTN